MMLTTSNIGGIPCRLHTYHPCTQNYNLIIVTSSAKEHKTQIYNDKLEIKKVN